MKSNQDGPEGSAKMRNSVVLRFVGQAVDPTIISEVLELVPSETRVRGADAPQHAGRKWPTGLWSLDSPLPESSPLSDHVRHFAQLLQTKQDALARLAATRGWRPDLVCGLFGEDPSKTAVILDAPLLEELGRLGVSLYISFYNQ